MFDNLMEYLHDELDELDHKVKNGEKISAADLQCGDIIAHFAKNIATYVAMEESGYSERGRSYNDGYDGHMSYRGENRREERRVRRTDRNGYSMAGHMEEMVDSVKAGMAELPDDMRREAERFISKLERQM